MMNTKKRDHIMRPFMSIMRPMRLPQGIFLRVVLYLIPPPPLWWIRHDFHYSRHARVPMLHEIFKSWMSTYTHRHVTIQLWHIRRIRTQLMETPIISFDPLSQSST